MSAPSDNLWVGDLPVGMDKGTLAGVFEAYGQIVECRMLPGRDETAKPAAMMRFASPDMAAWVVENLNGNIPEGLQEPIIARFANAGGAKGGKGGKGGDWGAAKGGGQPWGGAEPYGGGKGKGGFTPPAASDNVWIGDLPVGTEKHDLNGIFEAYGQIVDCRILPGRDPNAKPCAMIRFGNVDMATWVVDNLNGNIPEGLAEPIIARYANSSGGGGGKGGGGKGDAMGAVAMPWQQQGKGGGGKGSMDMGGKGGKGGKGGAPGSIQALFQSVKGSGILGGGTVPEDCQCFVKNLPSDTTDFGLYRLFSPFGAIPPTGVKAMMNPDGSCKGIGFVDFADATSAATAVMALDGHDGLGVSTKKPSTKGKGEGKDGKGKW